MSDYFPGWNTLFGRGGDYGSSPLIGVDTGRTSRVNASFVGNLVDNALFPPIIPSDNIGSGAAAQPYVNYGMLTGLAGGGVGYNNTGDSSQFYSISGIRNTARPYSAVRQIFGKWRVSPDHGADPYQLGAGDVQELYCLLDFGYGYVDVSDIKIGNTPIHNYPRIDYKVWHNYTDQRPWFYRNDHVTDLYDVEIKQNVWVTRTAPAKDSGSVAVHIGFPKGLIKYDQENNPRGETVVFRLEWQRNGGAWQPISSVPHITWSRAVTMRGGNEFMVNAMKTAPFSLWARLEFGRNSGQYAIRINRVHQPNHSLPKPVESHISKNLDQAMFSGLQSITFRPPLHFKVPHTVIELRIYASDELGGVLDNLTAMCQRHLPVWDGTSWTLQATRNPAWAAVEILRGDANPRPIPDEQIDLDAFKAWADWCDEPSAQGDPKFTLDANMDSESTVFQRLTEVMSSARASFTMKNGKYSVIWEKWPTVPMQVFTPTNSWGFTGQKSFTKQVDGLKVEWIDPNLDYQQTELIVYADGKDEKNSQLFETISVPYCTRWEQAFRDGRYHMAVGILRPELFTLITDIEFLVCERGDMVRLMHDVPRIGGRSGRIQAINGNQFVMEEPLVMAASQLWDIVIRYQDGTSELFEIDKQIDTHTIEIKGNPIQANVDDLVVYGKHDRVSLDFLVQSVTPGDQLTAILTLVPLSPEIKDADTGPIPPYDPPIGDDEWYPDCVGDVITDITLSHVNRYPVVDVLVSWTALPYAAAYEVWVSEDDDHYELHGRTAGTDYLLWDKRYVLSSDYPQDKLYLKVLPVTAFGTKPGLESCTAVDFDPPTDTTPPGKPLFFSGNVSGNIIHLTWLPPPDEDIGGYVLRYSPLITGAIWANATTERELLPHDSFAIDVNARIGTYLLKTIDTSGNYSEVAAQVRTTIPELDGMNVFLTAKEEPGFTGNKVNVSKQGDSLILDPVGSGPCGRHDYGIYNFSPQNTVDVGTVEEVYLMAEIEAHGDECIFMSDWLPNIAAINPIAATGENDWDVVMQVRTASALTVMMSDWVTLAGVNPIGAFGKDSDWSGWQTLTAGTYTGRYFQFRALLTTTNSDAWPVVDKLSVIVDMPDRIEAGHDLHVAVGGTKILFNGGAFKVPPALATTHDNAVAGDTLKITGIAADGFTAEIFNDAGLSIAGQIDYMAQGYGRAMQVMLPAIDPGKDDKIELMPEALRRPTSAVTLN